MIVAYLTALYPKTSHSFVRREIAALERLGFQVLRFSTRRVDEPLVDPDDIAERERTQAILDAGALGLLWAAFAQALRGPARFVRALRMALRLGRASEAGVLRHLVYLCEAAELVRLLRRGRAEHLHAHFATNSATIALLARLLGGPPYSFTAHGTDALDHAPLWALGEKVHHARFAVAVSLHARAHLMRFSATQDWERIHVVRCGLESAHFEPAPEPLPEEPRMLCVARFGEEKGHLLLLEAAGKLAAEGLRFELELVGDGPLRPAIEAAIARHGLRERVHLSGWLGGPDVRARMNASRVLVLPSLAEGLPVVLMESLAAGRPVIATQVGAIAELVQPGVNGWLVPPASPGDLANSMRAALSTPLADLQRMGAAGRERVAALHDGHLEARTLAALFRGEPHAPS
ncbi:MAG: glycosyltransferase [Planctomycetes bacterium]|nr:glycosyltransferase [Planctomycetota bacterium]